MAQNVGIGTLTPAASAKLEILDANRGLLIPRVSLVDITNGTTPVNAPVTSLLVYNTNAAVTGGSGVGFYYWSGTIWVKLVPSTSVTNDWAILGNAGTSPATNFLGTTDNQALVFRTNNIEDARISTNGNVSIGSTNSTAGRLYNYLPATDVLTPAGIYNINEGAFTGAAYGIRNYNYNTTPSTKYGLYNYTDDAGIGTHYGIYSLSYMNAASTGSGFGVRSLLSGNGTGTMYGTYTQVTQAGTGTAYGNYNLVTLPVTNTADAFGQYHSIDYSSGTRYGEYKAMNSNATYDGDMFGDFNEMYGSGDGLTYGMYNSINVTGTGTKFGIRNQFEDVQGAKFGIANFASGANAGTFYGLYNENYNTSASTQYGVYSYLDGSTGPMRGNYNVLYPGATNASTCYGVYGYVGSAGTGAHYGGYFNAFGAGNYSVYATNTDAGGYSGYFYGNLNIRSSGRTYGLYADYANSVVRIGTNNGSLNGNGSTVVGTVVDYVADMDNGAATGTAIGIGSIEYLLDGVSRTTINNEFDPAAHITHDLGWSTTTEAWDDVYADDYWNVSDIREKEEITEMTYGLAEIMRMRTIHYKLKQDPFKDNKIGLVAQEVVKLVPEAVKTHDNKVTDESKPDVYERVELERMGMNYGTLVPVLIKAVQEQQAQIEELKAEVAKLKNK